MAEQKNRPSRRRRDPGRRIQRLLVQSGSPEEVLFKINELLFQPGEGIARKNIRAPVSLPVNYRVAGRDYAGLSYTLSQDGLFIKSPDPFPKDTILDLELTLPGEDKPILIQAEVVHRTLLDEARLKSGISGMAVVFRRIRSLDQRRIDRFVRSRARQMFHS